MSKYPQIHVGTKYQEFLNSLTGVGKPDTVDQGFVKKLGFKSSYDASFLSAIKFIGLVEDKRGGGPTELWSKLRSDTASALAEGLAAGYRDLFEFYPDAHLRDEEALANYFRANSDGDSDAVSRMVTAFVAVRDLADFNDQLQRETIAHSSLTEENSDEDEVGSARNVVPVRTPSQVSSVNVNIQLQLPPDATGEVYDKFFEAMKKHGLV